MSYHGRKLSWVLQEVRLSGIKLTIYEQKINRQKEKRRTATHDLN